jgi:cyclic pyranopterin phosphate synthase
MDEHRQLTHLDESGAARMVDVGAKPETKREATAECMVVMVPGSLAAGVIALS